MPGWGTVIEVCTAEDSNLGLAANEFSNVEVIRITKNEDFAKPSTVERVKQALRDKPGTSLHGSLPCTVWSTWQHMAIAKHGSQYLRKLEKRRKRAIKMLVSFIQCEELGL